VLDTVPLVEPRDMVAVSTGARPHSVHWPDDPKPIWPAQAMSSASTKHNAIRPGTHAPAGQGSCSACLAIHPVPLGLASAGCRDGVTESPPCRETLVQHHTWTAAQPSWESEHRPVLIPRCACRVSIVLTQGACGMRPRASRSLRARVSGGRDFRESAQRFAPCPPRTSRSLEAVWIPFGFPEARRTPVRHPTQGVSVPNLPVVAPSGEAADSGGLP